MEHLTFSSELAASSERVWLHASSFQGINHELWPLHMSPPRGVVLDEHVTLNRTLFRSLVSLLRVLPLDVHSLGLAALWPGRGFSERSHSWLQRQWNHERTIEPTREGGCIVRDQLSFEPRFMAALIARIVRLTFERRHQRLRALFAPQ